MRTPVRSNYNSQSAVPFLGKSLLLSMQIVQGHLILENGEIRDMELFGIPRSISTDSLSVPTISVANWANILCKCSRPAQFLLALATGRTLILFPAHGVLLSCKIS